MSKRKDAPNTPQPILNQAQIGFSDYNPYDLLLKMDSKEEVLKKNVKVLILDRDGVININSKKIGSRYYYITDKSDVIIKDGVIEALARIKKTGIPVYLASRQKCISKGIVSYDQVQEINKHIECLIDFKFTEIFIEAFHDNKIKLFEAIKNKHQVNPSDIFLIDDSKEECETASSLGFTTFLSDNLDLTLREFFANRNSKEKHRLTNPLKGGRFINLTGLRFGHLTVLNAHRKNVNGICWICECDCGKKVQMTTTQLRKRKYASCGCKHYMKKDAIYNYTGYKDITGTRWHSLVSGAKSRGLEMCITKKIVWDLFERQNRKCALSGIDISFTDGTASVDRRNSLEGYLIDNIQVVHKDINIIKMDLEEGYFVSLCKAVAKWKQDA